MPINQNHLFEELDGVKCSIVEKNASGSRVAFLKKLLAFNGYNVVVAATPAPKAAPVKPAPKPVAPAASADGATAIPSAAPVAPATVEGTPIAPTAIPVIPATPEAPPPPSFTVGVTDLIFNPTNAIFGRLLRTPDGHVVTLAYWNQKEAVPQDDVPYFENKV